MVGHVNATFWELFNESSLTRFIEIKNSYLVHMFKYKVNIGIKKISLVKASSSLFIIFAPIVENVFIYH